MARMSTIPNSRFIDLSHPMRSGMDVAPGLPAPRIEAFLTREASRSVYSGMAEFEITRLFLVGNTGTSLDSPFHRFDGGADVAHLPLDKLMGLPGLCIDGLPVGTRSSRAIGGRLLEEPLSGWAVLIRTGWERRWGRRGYWDSGPFLAAEFVEALIAAEVALVGVDFANIDDRDDPARPAHTRLLGAGIPIVENLRALDRLPERGFRLHAPVLAIESGAALPVRVIAELDQPMTSKKGDVS
jgi:kynurenine formamidase